MVTLLYQTLYDTAIWRTWVMDAGRNFAFKTGAKALQIVTWLLLTSYRNSSSPYPTVPPPTSYGVRFSHNTCVTEYRQTHRTQGST